MEELALKQRSKHEQQQSKNEWAYAVKAIKMQ